jgi:glycosyltransferase involved in cell wall biosynthesis
MRIGLIAPIWEPTPPTGYGGIERVVDVLARHLDRMGHEVTLYATGDSTCPVERVWSEPIALRQLGLDTWSGQMSEAIHLSKALQRHREFDIWHNHAGPLGVAFGEAVGARMITTLHGPLGGEADRGLNAYAGHPYVSISHSQRAGNPGLSYLGTVYNGIETATYGLGARQEYLLFLGRVSPEKGTHLAIEVARAVGRPLVIAGKVDPADRVYYEEAIAPHIDGSAVRFIGEVAGARKREVLQGAIALLHLVQWPEPFGLVMVEAMACGTPVIAMPQGSIPEVITHGRTGFVVGTVHEAMAALGQVEAIDPQVCRQEARARFDAERMAIDYLSLYEQLAFATL